MLAVTIDPGSRSAGLALWGCDAIVDGALWQLLRASRIYVVSGDPSKIAVRAVAWLGSHRSADIVVCELPMEYGRHAARTNDLVTLSIAAGALVRALGPRERAEVRWRTAPEWKGSVPKPKSTSGKYIIAERARALLSPVELQGLDDVSGSAAWDMWDAIGIGLVEFGRAARGLV